MSSYLSLIAFAARDVNALPFDPPFLFVFNIARGGNWGSDASMETDGRKNGIDPNLTSVQMEVALH